MQWVSQPCQGVHTDALQLKARIIANVSALDPAPGVAFHERAPDAMDTDDFADRGADVSPLLYTSSFAGTCDYQGPEQQCEPGEGSLWSIDTLLLVLLSMLLLSLVVRPSFLCSHAPKIPVKQHCSSLRCMRDHHT